jgi:glutamine amidotransferase
MKVVVVKYNAGNVESVIHALSRLGITAELTDDAKTLGSADKVIFPGVGEAKSCMQYLKERALDQVILSLKQPVLGICLGLQLLSSYSEENDTECLGVFKNPVRRFSGKDVKVPHMGWNQLSQFQGPLFKGISEDSFLYFVHSYYLEVFPETIASCTYGETFSAAVQKDNFYGVQFHPEKSASVGERILNNFLSL